LPEPQQPSAVASGDVSGWILGAFMIDLQFIRFI